jgi:D-serine deaminase-like pyridoxal phosphate-dependent protein
MVLAGYYIGAAKETIDTPALLVDLDIMEANIARIARTCREKGVSWRPHVKANKTVGIVRKELSAGAIGITCAKLSEAEIMADAGVRNILIANQIVGRIKIARLLELLERASVTVAVDSIENVDELAAAADRSKRIPVVIEVNIGMDRAGVQPIQAVVSLANEIAGRPGLRFMGVMGWESHAVTIADPVEKRRVIANAISHLSDSADACRRAGHEVLIVSCGGTGTFPFCVEQPGITEVQVGGGIFGDVHYREHYHVDFPCALTILATVTSRPTTTRIVLDAGKKAMSSDAAMPQPVGLPDVRQIRLSAEHATVELSKPSDFPAIGDRLEFAVGYSDTTIHLHEKIFGLRNSRIENVWQVDARSALH